MVPIVISCVIWGAHMHGQSVLFQCDNKGVVAAVNKGSSKEFIVMQLLRTLWFFEAQFQIFLFIEHIPGMHNEADDMLSKKHIPIFHLLSSGTPPDSPHGHPRLDLTNLHSAVQHYYQQGLATSTHKSYQAGQSRYVKFCTDINRTPLPACEDT